MGTVDFRGYLALLQELGKTLERLTAIEQDKTKAALNDELDVMNECMKQEQAMSLALRGFEQRQQAALKALGLTDVPLSSLAAHAPEDLAMETRKVVEALQTQYALFHGAFEVAQNTLECNLHQVEKILADLGAVPVEGLGYEDPGPELPKPMRTDFRA